MKLILLVTICLLVVSLISCSEKQKLNEAMAELQELTSPTKASASPAPQ